MKKYYYKLPFRIKLWWAKQLLYMFRGFGKTFNDDIVLYNELQLWIETNGKPYSKHLKKISYEQRTTKATHYRDNGIRC